LHARFLDLLPKIQQHAGRYFGHIKCPAKKADKVADCVALGWKWLLRITAKGKDISQFQMVFVYLVARAVKCGRKVTGMEKVKDALSARAQQRHGFFVESLPTSTQRSHEILYGPPRRQELDDLWEEWLLDNDQTPIPEQVAFRLDWPTFFSSLSERDRQLAEFLALGHSAKNAAQRFKLSPGRVTQLRQQWCREWRAFCGELSAEEATAAEGQV
jgi:hypothetical protein